MPTYQASETISLAGIRYGHDRDQASWHMAGVVETMTVARAMDAGMEPHAITISHSLRVDLGHDVYELTATCTADQAITF